MPSIVAAAEKPTEKLYRSSLRRSPGFPAKERLLEGQCRQIIPELANRSRRGACSACSFTLHLLQKTLNPALQHVPCRNTWTAGAVERRPLDRAGSVRQEQGQHSTTRVTGSACGVAVDRLSVYRQFPMWQTMQQLPPSLDTQSVPASSASVLARQCLGREPLEPLFPRARPKTAHSVSQRKMPVSVS